MTQIKSENAKRILQAYYVDGDNNRHLFFLKGLEALEIAEKAAEQRHAKELQELKDYIESILEVVSSADYLCEVKRFVELNANFTQKLTK